MLIRAAFAGARLMNLPSTTVRPAARPEGLGKIRSDREIAKSAKPFSKPDASAASLAALDWITNVPGA